MKRLLCLLVVLGLVCVSSVPAFAILGIGDIVFDPSNYAEAIRQALQLEKEYEQLILTYEQVRGQLDHLRAMARQVPVNMHERYRAVATPWRPVLANDTYGNAGAWASALNGAGAAPAGYRQATTSLDDYGAAFSNIPADQRDHVKASFANVELTDGVNVLGMETVGQLRANASQVEGTIGALEQDSLSSDPAMNTEIAVLNKINAANIVALRNTQDTNKLLANLVEQQTLEAKRVRDAEARAIHADVRFRTEGKAVLDAQSANSSQAMLAWRMP